MIVIFVDTSALRIDLRCRFVYENACHHFQVGVGHGISWGHWSSLGSGNLRYDNDVKNIYPGSSMARSGNRWLLKVDEKYHGGSVVTCSLENANW